MGPSSSRSLVRAAARRRGDLTVAWIVLMAAATPGWSGAQQGRPSGGVITGRVIDSADGRPLAGTEVSLDDASIRAITDENGTFRLTGVAGGAHVLRARRIGYRERSDSLRVPPGVLVDVTMALSTEAIELEELVVVLRSPTLARHGFYARQRQGYGGSFVDRLEIEKRNPDSVTDLFRNMPGLRVVWGGIYGSRVFINQRVTFRDDGMPGCEPDLWLDGIRSTMTTYDLMRVEEIEGIEVYSGSSAPGKFNSICGTVVIWTRVPIR